MEIKDILVCLDPTEGGEKRLRLAAQLASRHHAQLSAAYIVPEEAPGYAGLGFHAPAESAAVAEGALVAGVPVPASLPSLKGDYARRMKLADIVEQRFRETLQPQVIAGDWYLFGSGEADDLSALARATDLVIYGQNLPEYRPPSGFEPEDVILACGRPVLVAPYIGDFPEVGRRALVAWDGSREAARAAHDAIPLLAEAERVTLLMVSRSEAEFERDKPGLDRILKNYEQHGIRSRLEHDMRGDLSVSDLLLSRASDLAVDMIVAGAYHHSPLRETIFGGVTRDLLDHMTVPVLMSH